MNTLRIPYHGKDSHFQFASTWDEIKPKTLHKLLPLIAEAQLVFRIYQDSTDKEAADLRLQELRIKIVWLLLDLPWYAFFKKRAFLSLFADELSDILDACDFLLEQPLRNTPPFSEIKVGRLRLIPPGDALQNLSAEEFHFLGNHLKKLSELKNSIASQKQKVLERAALQNEIAYALYRPKGKQPEQIKDKEEFSGDERIRFNRHNWEIKARIFQNVAPWKKELIIWWYSQLLLRIQASHPLIFTKKAESQANRYGWLPVFRQLAKNPLQTEKIGSLKLSYLLYELNQLIEESDRLKSRYAKS
jgi:hypothetical protein